MALRYLWADCYGGHLRQTCLVGDDQIRKKKREGVASGCASLTWTSKYRLSICIYEKEALFSIKKEEGWWKEAFTSRTEGANLDVHIMPPSTDKKVSANWHANKRWSLMFSDRRLLKDQWPNYLIRKATGLCNLLVKQFFLKIIGLMSHEGAVAVWSKYDLSPLFYLSWRWMFTWIIVEGTGHLVW